MKAAPAAGQRARLPTLSLSLSLSHAHTHTRARAAHHLQPRHFGYLERSLEGSATGWVCSTPAPSPADFAWGTHLYDVRTGAVGQLGPESLAPFPRINAFLDKFAALPQVKAYYGC